MSAERLTYGVATKNIRADAESLYEGVFDAARDTPNLPVMYFRRHGSRAVLIRTLKEERVVSLTLSEELLRVSDTITQFAEIVTQDVPGANQINSARVIARLLEQACREGHGIIVRNQEHRGSDRLGKERLYYWRMRRPADRPFGAPDRRRGRGADVGKRQLASGASLSPSGWLRST